MTDAERTKLAGIAAGAQVNTVGEAPIDNKQYARRNGGWIEVTGGGSSGIPTYNFTTAPSSILEITDPAFNFGNLFIVRNASSTTFSNVFSLRINGASYSWRAFSSRGYLASVGGHGIHFAPDRAHLCFINGTTAVVTSIAVTDFTDTNMINGTLPADYGGTGRATAVFAKLANNSRKTLGTLATNDTENAENLATVGYVDAKGGAGGGSTLYEHNISIEGWFTVGGWAVSLSIVTPSATAFTLDTFKNWLVANDFSGDTVNAKRLTASGRYNQSGASHTVVGVTNALLAGSYLQVITANANQNQTTLQLHANMTVNRFVDSVVTLGSAGGGGGSSITEIALAFSGIHSSVSNVTGHFLRETATGRGRIFVRFAVNGSISSWASLFNITNSGLPTNLGNSLGLGTTMSNGSFNGTSLLSFCIRGVGGSIGVICGNTLNAGWEYTAVLFV